MYDFSEDSVLLCFASEHYDPNEYIRDYKEFQKEILMKNDDRIIPKEEKKSE